LRDYPAHWLRGQLLNHMLFDKGRSRCILLHESHIEKPEYLDFSTREEAQAFISWWYAPASVKLMERECQDIPPPIVNIPPKRGRGRPKGAKNRPNIIPSIK
jgi:hypothetical protein